MPTRLFFWGLLLVPALFVATVQASTPPSARVRVTFFLSTECPISQQYLPQLRKLHREFSGKGVDFRAYFPLRTDDSRMLSHFRRDYPLPFPTLPDTDHRQVRWFRATIIPEVVVQDQTGTVVYQGAIDDWYVDLGKHRPEPTQPYLRNALTALLDGRPVAIPKTEAVGCFIE